METTKIFNQIAYSGIMPTTFVYDLDETVMLAKTLNENGIHTIELLQRTPDALQAIAEIKNRFPDMIVGAGTILDIDKAKAASAAGADYLVTPFYAQAIVDWCLSKEVAIIPGCGTITEVSQGYKSGLRCFKLFPAKQLGGVEYVRQISEIFDDARYIVTGGVEYTDLLDFAANEYVMAVGTVCMMPQKLIHERNWDAIAALTRKAIAASLGIEPAYAIGEERGETQTMEMISQFSLGRAGVPPVPKAIAEMLPKRSLGFYTNSVERSLAWLSERGIEGAVLQTRHGRPAVADVELPGCSSPVRLILRGLVYRV